MYVTKIDKAKHAAIVEIVKESKYLSWFEDHDVWTNPELFTHLYTDNLGEIAIPEHPYTRSYMMVGFTQFCGRLGQIDEELPNIELGGETVEYKDGYVEVGCTIVSNEEVRFIARNLKG